MAIEWLVPSILFRAIYEVAAPLLPARPLEAVGAGILGNQADRISLWAAKRGWKLLSELRTSDPSLNHDLQRAVRRSYLLASQELVRQAEDRVAARARERILLRPDDVAQIRDLRRAIEAELGQIDTALPDIAVADADLLLLDEASVPAERWTSMQVRQRELLRHDMSRWLRGTECPPILFDLVESGWPLVLSDGQIVQRNWHALIAIAFMEELKTDSRVRAVFDSRILAELKNRDNALAPVSSFDGFQAAFDRLQPPLERIERGLAVMATDVKVIRDKVDEIAEQVVTIRPRGLPRWAIGGLLLAGGVVAWLAIMHGGRSAAPRDEAHVAPAPVTIEQNAAGNDSPQIVGATAPIHITYGASKGSAAEEASK